MKVVAQVQAASRRIPYERPNFEIGYPCHNLLRPPPSDDADVNRTIDMF
jgi:hypothetical protein